MFELEPVIFIFGIILVIILVIWIIGIVQRFKINSKLYKLEKSVDQLKEYINLNTEQLLKNSNLSINEIKRLLASIELADEDGKLSINRETQPNLEENLTDNIDSIEEINETFDISEIEIESILSETETELESELELTTEAAIDNNAQALDTIVNVADIDNTSVSKEKPNLNKRPTFGIYKKVLTGFKKLFNWFMKGNPLAKLGALLLLFGLGYLGKYSIENAIFPLLYRLVFSACLSVGLLITGWRLRKKNRLYSLLLQGTSVGGFYITVLAASSRVFDFIPSYQALIIIVLICTMSIMLAIMQNSILMAFFSSFGGYLAPIILSNGEGSYLALFSYYLILSLGILVCSIKNNWRELNLIGMLFTFGVGIFLGYTNYSIEGQYIYCQLLLIANILIFGIFSNLFVGKYRHKYEFIYQYISFFTPPLIGFVIQYYITVDWAYGPAISAFCYGLFYLLFMKGYQKYQTNQHITSLSYCIAITFIILSIPLAVSNIWVMCVWLIAGYLVIVAGLKNRNKGIQYLGFIVIFLNYIPMIQLLNTATSITTMTNIRVLNYAVLIWVNANILLSLDYVYKKFNVGGEFRLLKYLRNIVYVSALLLWGCSLALFMQSTIKFYYDKQATESIYTNCLEFLSNRPEMFIFILVGLFSTWLWYCFGSKFKLVRLQLSSLSIIALLFIVLIDLIFNSYSANLPSLVHFISWLVLNIILLASALMLLNKNSKELKSFVLKAISLYPIVILIIACFSVGFIFNYCFIFMLYGFNALKTAILISGIAFLVMKINYDIKTNTDLKSDNYLIEKLTFIFVLIPLYVMNLVSMLTLDGVVLGINFIPILNPFELSLIITILTGFNFQQRLINKLNKCFVCNKRALISLTLILINSSILRAVAYYTDVSWNWEMLWGDTNVQMAISIIWAVIGIAIIHFAYKYEHRRFWFVGLSLLLIIIAKLFSIDIHLSNLQKAITFIIISLLLLLIGYLAPLPPKIVKKENSGLARSSDQQQNSNLNEGN